MAAEQAHFIRTVYLSGATGPVAVGNVLVPNGTKYVVATSANRTSYGRSACIALTAGDNDDTAVHAQFVGYVPASVTGLGSGAATWVIVSATGTLERDSTPDSGDDVVGKCNARGDLFLQPGTWDETNTQGGSSFTAPTGTGFMTTTSGAMDAAATAFPATIAMGGTGASSLGAGLIQSDGSALSSMSDGSKSYVLEMFDSGAGAVKRWGLRDRPTLANTGTGTLDDVATTDANGNQVEILRWAGASTATITSLASPTQSRILVILNAAGSDTDLVLGNASGTGTAANRILTPDGNNLTVRQNYAAVLRYDSTSSRWRVVAGTAMAPVNLTNSDQVVVPDEGVVFSDGTVLDSAGYGAAGEVLATNASGDGVEWIAAAAGASPGGNAGELQYNNGAGGFAGATNVQGGAGYITIGATAATAGSLRLASAGGVYFRNAADTANVPLIISDASDNVTIGNGTTVATMGLAAASYIALRAGSLFIQDAAGSADRVIVSSTGVQFGATGGTDHGGGTGVIGIDNAIAEPTSNATGGAIWWVFGGASKARGSGGTVQTFGPAEPHCRRCGTDVGVTESRNDIFGEYLLHCRACELRRENGVVEHYTNFFERKRAA